jgi:hypothetical protein
VKIATSDSDLDKQRVLSQSLAEIQTPFDFLKEKGLQPF